MSSSTSTLTDTIVALSTPSGAGAIAVIRLSGSDAITICNKVFSGKDLEKQVSHTVHFGLIKSEEIVIDEVLATIFIAPRSYTKENIVEVSCHASAYIIRQIIELFVKNGARLAKPGEFTLRAFLNGQLDLSQAEAVADLIASGSASAHRLAMQQMRGGFSNEIAALRTQLVNFASLIELELDFSEEDVEFADRTQLKSLISKIHVELKKLIRSFELGNVLKNGIPVVIAGKPNVGKSTLLNKILNEEKAIVSATPGTTRDMLEDEVVIDGITFRFIDTAGIRETEDEIEAIGVARALERMTRSAVVLYLFDPEETTPAELKNILDGIRNAINNESAYIIPVANKMDKGNEAEWRTNYADFKDLLLISAKEQINIEQLFNSLKEKVIHSRWDEEGMIVSNIRHVEALDKTSKALDDVLRGMSSQTTSDFLAADIKQALYYMGLITGEVTTDDLLENIFSKFCIGK